MKPIFKTIIIIVTALLFVSFIGCSENDEDNMKDDVAIDFVDTTWQVVSINGLMFEKLFSFDEAEFETDFMLGANSWTFGTDGSFTGSLKFIITEKYTEPISSMTQEIDINSAGDYTVDGTTMTVTKHDLVVDVDVTLEPKEVWEQQLELAEITVEELEDDMAAETKLGFTPTVLGALFREGTEYTWSHEEESLTFSNLTQSIVLERSDE